MPVTATPIYPQVIKDFAAQILNADASTKKTLVTGGTNGTRIDAITVASTDTAARDLQLWLNNGSIDLLLCKVTIPLSSGNTNGAPAMDILRSANLPGLPYDANGNKILYVASGWTLKVNTTTTVTTAKEIDVVCVAGGDY